MCWGAHVHPVLGKTVCCCHSGMKLSYTAHRSRSEYWEWDRHSERQRGSCWFTVYWRCLRMDLGGIFLPFIVLGNKENRSFLFPILGSTREGIYVHVWVCIQVPWWWKLIPEIILKITQTKHSGSQVFFSQTAQSLFCVLHFEKYPYIIIVVQERQNSPTSVTN